MSPKKQFPRALLPFYVLVIYVLVQFFWWSYLMVQQTKTINEQQVAMAIGDVTKQAHLSEELKRKWFMIAGEGSVFLGLMLLGIFQVRKAFRKESELLARQKTFLHSVTHEFKSPVASLRLQIETLLKRNLPNNLQQQALNNALEDTDRLDQLLEKILVAARIDNRELPVYPENLNVSDKIVEAITQASRAYPNRKIEQNIASNVFSYVDAWAFSSIVTNLLENALLYSPQDKAVEVSLSQKGNSAVLVVKDFGKGIPPEERGNIFQKFYRLNTNSKGTGLGLYLVDYFVKKHNGTITVKENSPEGSIFEVILPGKKV
jgi:two-component system phosphate regulon sensor histidine kinase PhoR